MGFDGFYFYSKKGKNINFASFDKLNNNKSTADLSKLLNIFDKDGNKTIDTTEMKSLFDELKQHAGTDNILSNDEFEAWCRMKPELENINTQKLYSDLNNVLTQEIFKYTNSEGNQVEDIVSYSEGRPSQVIRKINGKEAEELYYTYNEESPADSKVTVTIKLAKDPDNVKIITVPEVDNKGLYDSSQISTQCMLDLLNNTFLQLIKVDGKIYSETDCIFDGKNFALYNEYDISCFDEFKEGETEASLQLMIDESGEQYFVSYENGYTIFHAKLNETVDSLCRTFNISEAELLELNPELKKGVLVGQEIKIKGIYPVFAPEMEGRNNPVREEKKYLDHLQKKYEKELVENVSTYNKEYVVTNKDYANFAELLKELWETRGRSTNEEEFGLFIVSMIALNPEYAKGKITKGTTIISLKQSSINEKCLTNLKKAGYPMTLDNMEFYGRVGLLNEDLQLYLADLAADGDISEADKDAFNNKVADEIRRYEDKSGYTKAVNDASNSLGCAVAKNKSTDNINWPDRTKYNIPEFPRNIFDSGIILNISPYKLSYSGYNSNISANWATHANLYSNVQQNNNQEISAPNRLETILLNYNIDPNSADGKKIISRLKSFDTDSNGLITTSRQISLDENTDENWQVYFNTQVHNLSSENTSVSDFDRFANYLLTRGINIRTEGELKTWENSIVGQRIIDEATQITQNAYDSTVGAKLRFQAQQEQAIAVVTIYYDYIINLYKSCQDSNGILNVGTWREGAGQLISLAADLFNISEEDIAFCTEDIIKRLEKEKNNKIAELKKSWHGGSLSFAWERSMGTEYNPELIQSTVELAVSLNKNNIAKFENNLRQLTPKDYCRNLWSVLDDLIFDGEINYTNQLDAVKSQIDWNAQWDQLGDLAVMFTTLSTGWAKTFGANITKTLGVNSNKFLPMLCGSAATSGTMIFTYNGLTRNINLLTNGQENTLEDYNYVAESCFLDAGFGALGGMANALGYFTKCSILGNSAKNLASKYYTPSQDLKVRAQRIATGVGLGVEFATDIGTTYALQRGVLGKEVEAGQYVQSLVMTFAGGGAAYNVRSKFVDAETDFAFNQASYNHIRNMDYSGRLNFFKNDFKRKGMPDGIADVYATVMVEKYSAHFRKVEASNTSVSLKSEVTMKTPDEMTESDAGVTFRAQSVNDDLIGFSSTPYKEQNLDELLANRSQEDANLIKDLLSRKKYNGQPYYSNADSLLGLSTSELNFVKQLFDEIRLPETSVIAYDYINIAKSYTKNPELTQRLLAKTDADGCLVYTSAIERLVNLYEQDPEFIEFLLAEKDSKGMLRFNDRDLSWMLPSRGSLSQERKALCRDMAAMRNPDGSYRFSGKTIAEIVGSYFSPENIKYLYEKNPDGSYKYNDNIGTLFKALSIDRAHAEELLAMENLDGSARFTIEEIANIEAAKTYTSLPVDEFINIKKENGEYKYNALMLKDLFRSDDVTTLNNVFENIISYCDDNNISYRDMVLDNVTGTYKINADNQYIIFDKNGNVLKNADISHSGNKKFEQEGVNTFTSVEREFLFGHNIESTVREINDENGNLLYKEVYELSEVENNYNIYREEPSGRRFLVGSAEKTPSGITIVEKSLLENGIKTDYIMMVKDGERYSSIKITDQSNKILYESKQKFIVIDDNHFQSIENGITYDIQYYDEKVVVTKDSGETVEISIGDNAMDSPGVLSRDLLSTIKQLPGSAYFEINNLGLKKIFIGDGIINNACYNNEANVIAMSLELKDSFSTLLHEFGHYLDHCKGIFENPEFVATYTKERDAFLVNSSEAEREALSYFTSDSPEQDITCSMNEIIAETFFINNSIADVDINLSRAALLQKYFPETFAKASELLNNKTSL